MITKVLLAAVLFSAGGIGLAAAQQTMQKTPAAGQGISESQARYDLMAGPCGSTGISKMKKDAQGNWSAECASDSKHYVVSADGKISPQK